MLNQGSTDQISVTDTSGTYGTITFDKSATASNAYLNGNVICIPDLYIPPDANELVTKINAVLYNAGSPYKITEAKWDVPFNATGLSIYYSEYNESFLLIDENFVYYKTNIISLLSKSIVYTGLPEFVAKNNKNETVIFGPFDRLKWSSCTRILTIQSTSIKISQNGMDLRFGEFCYNYISKQLIKGDPYAVIRALTNKVSEQQELIDNLAYRINRIEQML